MNSELMDFLSWMNSSTVIIASTVTVIFLLTEIRKLQKVMYFKIENIPGLKAFPSFKKNLSMNIESINRLYFVCHMILLAIAWGGMVAADVLVCFFGYIIINGIMDTVITTLLINNSKRKES